MKDIVFPRSSSSRGSVVAYWITTGLLAFGMVAGGLAQIAHAEPNVVGMRRLGYPLYSLYFLGIWKILGAGALLERVMHSWAKFGDASSSWLSQ